MCVFASVSETQHSCVKTCSWTKVFFVPQKGVGVLMGCSNLGQVVYLGYKGKV